MIGGGSTYAHTAREHVGSLSRKHLDDQVDVSQISNRSTYGKATLGVRAAGPLACRRSGAYQTHTVQHVTSFAGLMGTSIEERRASLRRNGVPSVMYCNFGSGRNVVRLHRTPEKVGAVF